MSGIVWWKIETADPERFQQFHAALSGWSFEPAFADSELDADYWIIHGDGRSIGGFSEHPRRHHRPRRARASTSRSMTSRPLSRTRSNSAARSSAPESPSAATTAGSGSTGTRPACPSAYGPNTRSVVRLDGLVLKSFEREI